MRAKRLGLRISEKVWQKWIILILYTLLWLGNLRIPYACRISRFHTLFRRAFSNIFQVISLGQMTRQSRGEPADKTLFLCLKMILGSLCWIEVFLRLLHRSTLYSLVFLPIGLVEGLEDKVSACQRLVAILGLCQFQSAKLLL